jgi:hypothetical protein
MLYDLACVYALHARVAGGSESQSALDRGHQAEGDAARAVALLRQAIGRRNGKRLHESLTSDPDLEAFRGREEFRDLIRVSTSKQARGG